jgi:hypothetical protein
VGVISEEAKKDFAKRGWSGRAPHARDKVYSEGPPKDGGPVIWESFSYQIRGKSTVEILSSWWGLEGVTKKGGVPERKMTWLTQDEKKSKPTNYRRTPSEIKSGKRGPLIVPIKKGGIVVFRTAPLRMGEAWVHPGIARFTFIERAARKGRQKCAEIVAETFLDALAKGDPTR